MPPTRKTFIYFLSHMDHVFQRLGPYSSLVQSQVGEFLALQDIIRRYLEGNTTSTANRM